VSLTFGCPGSCSIYYFLLSVVGRTEASKNCESTYSQMLVSDAALSLTHLSTPLFSSFSNKTSEAAFAKEPLEAT